MPTVDEQLTQVVATTSTVRPPSLTPPTGEDSAAAHTVVEPVLPPSAAPVGVPSSPNFRPHTGLRLYQLLTTLQGNASLQVAGLQFRQATLQRTPVIKQLMETVFG